MHCLQSFFINTRQAPITFPIYTYILNTSTIINDTITIELSLARREGNETILSLIGLNPSLPSSAPLPPPPPQGYLYYDELNILDNI